MKNIIRLFGFIGLMAFAACDSDKFQPLVEIDIPPHTPRLVIRADWSVGSDSLAVFVSRSKGILDKDKANFSQTFAYFNGKDSVRWVNEYYDTVPNTKVELLRNGQLLGTIPYFNKGYHVAKGLFKLDTVSGVTYTIRVSAPNFETVEASQIIQNRFSVLRGGYKKGGAVYSEPFDPFNTPEKGDELTLELQDNGDDVNYYQVQSNNQNNRGWGTYISIKRDTLNRTYSTSGVLRNIDPTMEDGFLPDRAFNGKSYVWRFWLQNNNAFYFYNSAGSPSQFFDTKLKSGDRITLNIRSANKDFVLFQKTLELAANASDNPFFTEPVILHTNVKNGYGIFTIGSVQTVSFVIP